MIRRSWVAVASAVALAAPVFFWSPAPASGAPDQPKPKKPPAGADAFGHDKVWQIHLAFTADEYKAMQPAQQAGFGFPPPANPQPQPKPKPGERETHRSVFGTDFPWAFASLTADGKTIEKVGIRYKGNSTYLSTSRVLKRSLKVDLDKYDESARFRGLKSLNLHGGVMDSSKAREALAYSVYRAAGVPAPRTAFAEVTLTVPGKYDKEYVGVYTLVESVDKNFLKLHYKTDKGLLMKPERLRGLDYLGDDWERYKGTYQPKREAKPEEAKRVIEFTRIVNVATDADFDREIGKYLDIDAFLKFLAATAAVSNLDSFFTIGHNYCLYLHPETNKFHFIPWDVDLSLGNFPLFGTPEQQMDLSLTKPCTANRLADRVLANREFAERHRAILKEVLPVCFDKEKLLKEVAAVEKTVKPLIEKETKAVAARKENGGFGMPGPGPFGRQPPDLRQFVEKRSESIAAQLAGKSKGYVPAFGFGPPGGPGPGGPRPNPGEIFPAPLQNALQMTDKQKMDLAELQKKVDAELEKILTPEQKEQLKRMREGSRPGPGFGPPGGFAPPGGIGPPKR
jgi:spore coat protein H